MQSATVLTYRKPVQGNRYGKISKGLPGSESVACNERSVRNLGDPSTSSDIEQYRRGRTYQPQEERLMGGRESDHLIVLRDGRTVHTGKGMTILCSPQRKHMQIRQADKHMQTSLRGIAKRAKEDPQHRFGNLYSLLNEANLHWCFHQLNRKSAPGIDRVNWKDFGADLLGNVSTLVTSLKEKRYKAKLVRRRYIPKPGGKQRPLGIPAMGDKLVQSAVAHILSAIFEQDFLSCSHGYRRGKGPQRAALELSQRLHRGRFRWVFDADIKGFLEPSSYCTSFHERFTFIYLKINSLICQFNLAVSDVSQKVLSKFYTLQHSFARTRFNIVPVACLLP